MSDAATGPVVVIGAGYTGLSAAYELSQRGIEVIVLEADQAVGGLAGSFDIPGQRLEKFYHHWFTNDRQIESLTEELGVRHEVVHRETSTGNYYANTNYRLSTPLDVLRYKPLSLLGRLRLGFLVIQARMVRNWRRLETVSAADWIRQKAGNEVFERVWGPLLKGKFGRYADEVSAVWFWNKLVLRGGSRGKGGKEMLAYYRGGFAALADKLAQTIVAKGGEIRTGCKVQSLQPGQGCVQIHTDQGSINASQVLVTTALPLFADMVRASAPQRYLQELQQIDYLGNTCLTLILDRSLSDTYWLNITDPDFPYVGIIEHTNFEPVSSYQGRHVVYLSKYLPVDDPLYQMTPEQTFQYSLPFIQKMFPDFRKEWVQDYHVYKAEYSQPIVGKNYSRLIPDWKTPLDRVYLASMAQIYPEDRGTNYAIREGRAAGVRLANYANAGSDAGNTGEQRA